MIEDEPLSLREQMAQSPKAAKRKVAMLLAYCGLDYYGMRSNQASYPSKEEGPIPTIEEDLFKALVKSGAIPKEHARCVNKMQFERSVMTEKGVSAVGQVVSLKMLLLDRVVDKINEYLPPLIKVIGITRVTNSFNSKHNSDKTYMYVLPTFSFQPAGETISENYRASVEKIAEVNELLKTYLGKHNFHNFTSGKSFTAQSVQQVIENFSCSKPFLEDQMEFAVLSVRARSFLSHQICRMIGLMLAIVKGITPRSILEEVFLRDTLNIPEAPGLGLALEMVHYDRYNTKWGSDGIHEPLTWEDCKEKIEEFKKTHIYPVIVEKEKKERSMMQWLSTLHLHPCAQATKVEADQHQSTSEGSKNVDSKNDETVAMETTPDTTIQSDAFEDKTSEVISKDSSHVSELEQAPEMSTVSSSADDMKQTNNSKGDVQDLNKDSSTTEKESEGATR